jgi:albonoursin synthase
MSGTEVLDIIRSRRSIRVHTAEPVPPEVIGTLLDAARWAPTGGNRQQGCFVVVQEPLRIRRLAAVSPGLLGQPAALVVICADGRSGSGRSAALDEACSLIEAGMAAQNIMLAATALGLGSCPVRSFNPAAVRQLLKLPGGVEPELIITLGYAARPVPAPARRPAAEIVHWEEYSGQRAGEAPA